MAFKTNLTAGLRSQTFTTSGSFVVPPGVSSLIFLGTGGGGGGGGAGSGATYPGMCCGRSWMGDGGAGGGGAYPELKSIQVTPGQTIDVVVGAGGLGGTGGKAVPTSGATRLGGPGSSGGNGGNSQGTVQAAVNQVQRIEFSVVPVSGVWRISFRGAITGNLAFNISAAALQTAIQGLNTVGGGNVVVTGSVATGFDVTFQNNLGGFDWSVFALVSNTTGATITLSILTPGIPQSSVLFEGGLGGQRGTMGASPAGSPSATGLAPSETNFYTKRTGSGGGGGGGEGSSGFNPSSQPVGLSTSTPISTGGINGRSQSHAAAGGGGGAGFGNGGNGCQPYNVQFNQPAEPFSQYAKTGGYGAGGGGGCGEYSGPIAGRRGGDGGGGIVIIYY